TDLAAGVGLRTGQGVLVDDRVHRGGRHRGRPVRHPRVRGQVTVDGGRRGGTGRLADDVEADDARGRGEGGKDDTEGQDLLAAGDEAGLAGRHWTYSMCGGSSHESATFT